MKNIKNIILIVVVIFLAVIAAGVYKFNYLADKSGHDVDGNKITELEKSNLKLEDRIDQLERENAGFDMTSDKAETDELEYQNTTSSIKNTDEEYVDIELVKDRELTRDICIGEFCDGSGIGDGIERTSLNIPLIVDTLDGTGPIGCGVGLVYAPHFVPKTLGVLDATYKTLFNLKAYPQTEGDPRNTIGSYKKLHYRSVKLSDGVAKVYLTGNMYGPGHCAEPEIYTQINQAALQFPNINTVKVYLNGVIYDWCELDDSDGEGSCSEAPKLWIVTN